MQMLSVWVAMVILRHVLCQNNFVSSYCIASMWCVFFASCDALSLFQFVQRNCLAYAHPQGYRVYCLSVNVVVLVICHVGTILVLYHLVILKLFLLNSCVKCFILSLPYTHVFNFCCFMVFPAMSYCTYVYILFCCCCCIPKKELVMFLFFFQVECKVLWLAFSWRTLSSGLQFYICNPRAKSQGIFFRYVLH